MTRNTNLIGLMMLAAGLLAPGCGGGGSSSVGPDGGSDVDGSTPPDNCPTGTQDGNGDGMCNPDCTQTACVNGTCDIGGDGLALCTCDTAFEGDACDQVIVPDAAAVVFWVDAADSGSITTHAGKTTVASWTDKSPKAYVGTSAAEASAPAVLDNALNGLPVLSFDGDNDHVSFLNFDGVKNAAYTIFLVVRVTDETSGTIYQGIGANDGFEGSGSTTSAAHYHEPQTGASDVDEASENYGDDGWSPDEFHLVTYRLASQDVSMWVDGNNMKATATVNSGKITEDLALTLGGRDGGGNAFTGEIAELIIVADDLHHGERLPYENYLGAKWFGAPFERNPSAFGVANIWLDASAAGDVSTAGDAVTSWLNHGIYQGFFGNGAFPDSRPTLVANGLNGHPVVRFDGSDALAQNDISVAAGGVEGAHTIIAVVVPPSTGDSQLLFRADKSGLDKRGLEMLLDPSGPNIDFLQRWPAGDAGGDVLSPTADFSSPMIIKIERNAAASYHMVIGESSSTVSGDIATNIKAGEILGWALGGETVSEPGAGLNGDIAEFIVLGNPLGNAEETALLDMLSEKWGL